jgi:hypothetical protein
MSLTPRLEGLIEHHHREIWAYLCRLLGTERCGLTANLGCSGWKARLRETKRLGGPNVSRLAVANLARPQRCLCYLGIDLSRYSLHGRNNAAVSIGRRAIHRLRRIFVLVASRCRRSQTHAGRMAQLSDRRHPSSGRRQRRRGLGGTIHSV